MIKLLDEALVNKIAAGEVIDRPFNVVKELVENSLDAGALRIVVEAGPTFIRVTDDGSGIQKDDLQLAVRSHATSKIESFDDLQHVSTLGFRGEALASIAAVSFLTILSKTTDSYEGNELCLMAGKPISFRTVAAKQGSLIEVRDLFFNTPVRKKFLDMKEDERITSFLEKFALGTKTSVKLILHTKTVLDVNASDLLDRIAQVYGTEVVSELVPVHYENDFLSIKGFVSKPSLVRRDTAMQALFVNGRLVESEEITSALYDAYKSLLFVNKHPIAVLSLQMFDGVDVNVHPTKKIVKFSFPDKIRNAVFDAVRTVFKEEILDFQVQEKYIPTDAAYVRPTVSTQSKRFVKEHQKSLVAQEHNEKKYVHFPEMRILGNIAKTFFLTETEEGLMIIDQHVVEERINYEKFMKQYMNKAVAVQDLLQAELIDFSPAEAMVMRRNLEKMKGYGFFLEEFGENTFRLTRVPVLFNKIKGSELLRDLLVDFKEDEKEDIITMMSCRKSVKAGDVVSVAEMYILLKELDLCELPYTCPHGRPIMVKLPLGDIEKMFRRKGF
ncbi:DNA mismatch repair endonuclease MutL [Candidatus Woesearchaeota archaeon]|nr:DNA mismatch repair endonuclease MutL [Candidatus Woesearchaeota archaeon]